MLVLLGFVVGTIGTLVGAGGGFILVPVLLLVDPALTPRVVTAISLAVVAANAVSGSVAYARGGRIAWSFAAWFSIWSLPGAALGVWLVSQIERQQFKPAFAVLLFALALYTLVRAKQTKGGDKAPELGPNATKGAMISVFVGVAAAFLGIGGGIIHVPLMVYWLHIATATSHVVLAVTAIGATALHVVRGDLQGQMERIGLLAIGVIIGARLSTKVEGAVDHARARAGAGAGAGGRGGAPAHFEQVTGRLSGKRTRGAFGSSHTAGSSDGGFVRKRAASASRISGRSSATVTWCSFNTESPPVARKSLVTMVTVASSASFFSAPLRRPEESHRIYTTQPHQRARFARPSSQQR